MLISNLLKENNVKVTLTGDGGDEIFGGYNRYVWGPRVLAIFKFFNQENRKRLSKIISFLKTNAWDSFGLYYNKLVTNKYKVENFGYKIYKLTITKKIDEQDAYNEIVSIYSNPEGIISRDLEKVLSTKN